MGEPIVRARAIDDAHPVGGSQKCDLLIVQEVAVNDQCAMGAGQKPQIVQRPRSARDGRRVPCPKLFQKAPQRPAAVPQQLQLLGRLGQVHGHGNLVPVREFDDRRQQVGMHAVRGVRTQAHNSQVGQTFFLFLTVGQTFLSAGQDASAT